MRFIAPLAAALSFGLAVTPALAVVAAKATADDRTAFQQMDADRDGRISRAEFDQARTGAFSRADTDRNGKLAGQEFRALIPTGAERSSGRPSAEQLERLRGLDQNGDRAIDATEYAALGGRMFATLDANGDGAVTSDEARSIGSATGLGQ